LAEREEKKRVLSSERAHKQVSKLTVKKNMHLVLNSSTGTLVTEAEPKPLVRLDVTAVPAENGSSAEAKQACNQN